MRKLPSQEILNELLRYNPDTGSLISNRTGKIMGNVHKNGYIRIGLTIDGVAYEFRASRIIWKIVHGKDPEKYIDHINGDTSDNRLCNLREADESENNFNSKKRSSNRYKGVFKQKSKKGKEYTTWSYEIRIRGIRYRACGFLTEEEAYDARCDFGLQLHGEFFRSS